ncbi:MAG: hypothetical protein CMN21_01245 [Rubinisphaera sp.]|nr:hypothetical protein [Rubinisphaera sp.]
MKKVVAVNYKILFRTTDGHGLTQIFLFSVTYVKETVIQFATVELIEIVTQIQSSILLNRARTQPSIWLILLNFIRVYPCIYVCIRGSKNTDYNF